MSLRRVLVRSCVVALRVVLGRGTVGLGGRLVVLGRLGVGVFRHRLPLFQSRPFGRCQRRRALLVAWKRLA